LEQSQQRAGFCAIVGAPNAGKSTLVNQLTGAKVSIVSHKAQTTRARIRAIYIEGDAQVILVDTPGIFAPKRKLDELMVSNAWEGAGQSDAVVLLIDARSGLNDGVRSVIEGLRAAKTAPFLAINKIDLVRHDDLLPLVKELNDLLPFRDTFMINALSGAGVAKLKRAIAECMPVGPWLYPEDQVADVNLRFIAAEITREKIYERLHDELPYASTVETEAWEERKDGSVKITQAIFVERDGQKAIVLGKGGQSIKLLGQLARADMEKWFERRVHLFLFVKVREKWAQDPERLRMMGLEF
jgi:GTPase